MDKNRKDVPETLRHDVTTDDKTAVSDEMVGMFSSQTEEPSNSLVETKKFKEFPESAASESTQIAEETKLSVASADSDDETEKSAKVLEITSEKSEKVAFDESPIIVTDVPAKRKKFLKPWSELTKKERVNRVLAVVMAIVLIAIVTFTTVWCCTIADKAYNTPQWKTEREVYRNNVEKTLGELGSGLKVAEEKFGENPRWFIVAKERYDMRYRLFPENDNVAGYRYMFLKTYRETNDSTVTTWNINGYVENFNGVTNKEPVLTDDDGEFVELSFWDFKAREKTFSTSGEDGIVYANYQMSAIIDGRLYTVSAQYQSPNGKFDVKLSERIRQDAKNVMTHLSDINL